jgi:tetratricopeptide (TPR) repeat protein
MCRFALSVLWPLLLPGQSTQSPQELLKKAVSLQQQGKLGEAIEDYTLFLQKYPDAAQVRSNLGAALVGVGQYARAIEQYKLALKTKPDNAVRLNLALVYYKSAEFGNAASELEAIHSAEPQNEKATMLLADCQLRQGNNKNVIDLLNSLHQAKPNDLGVAYLLGMGLLRDGQSAEGQAVIDPILRAGDSAEAHLLMGTAKFGAKEFAPAVADFAKAVELNDKLPDAWSYYGQALFATGDLTGSRKAFLTELEHDPNDFQANLHVGAMFRLDQDYEHALPYFQRAEAVRPSDPAIRYQIALVDIAEGKIDPARQSLESIVKVAPSFVEAHVSLATVYYREKRKQDGDRERAIVQKLNAAKQAEQPGAKQTDAEKIMR